MTTLSPAFKVNGLLAQPDALGVMMGAVGEPLLKFGVTESTVALASVAGKVSVTMVSKPAVVPALATVTS